MRIMWFLFILSCDAQSPADDIMAKVAANLEQGSELHNSYVYTQKLHTRLLRTNSKLAREAPTGGSSGISSSISKANTKRAISSTPTPNQASAKKISTLTVTTSKTFHRHGSVSPPAQRSSPL